MLYGLAWASCLVSSRALSVRWGTAAGSMCWRAEAAPPCCDKSTINLSATRRTSGAVSSSIETILLMICGIKIAARRLSE
jgi:hypothetical protein